MKGKNKMSYVSDEDNPKTRRYCASCNKKRYIQNMTKVYYPLLKTTYWFCNECFIKRDTNKIIQVGIDKMAIDFK